jgi:hypothetical protein
MAMVKVFVKLSCAIPIKEEAIIMCPVEDTGKNSVKPSIMAKIIACKIDIFLSWKLEDRSWKLEAIPALHIITSFHLLHYSPTNHT